MAIIGMGQQLRFTVTSQRGIRMLKIVEKDTRKLAILTLSGDPLGEYDAKLIREKSHEVAKSGIRHLLFDMNGVLHINSAGLGGLIAALLTMTREGGVVKFAGVRPNVDKIFSITHLKQIFDIVPSIETATQQWLNNTT